MNARLAELHRQRGQLQERIAHQRLELAERMQPLQAWSDTARRVHALGIGLIDYLRRHKLQVGLAVAGLALLRPRRAWRWIWRGAGVWRSWRTLRAWLPAAVVGRWF